MTKTNTFVGSFSKNIYLLVNILGGRNLGHINEMCKNRIRSMHYA